METVDIEWTEEIREKTEIIQGNEVDHIIDTTKDD